MPESDPSPMVLEKFETLLKAYRKDDYQIFCTVISEGLRKGIPESNFLRTKKKLQPFFDSPIAPVYMGDLKDREKKVYLWKFTGPGLDFDVFVRVWIYQDQVTGILFSRPFDALSNKKTIVDILLST